MKTYFVVLAALTYLFIGISEALATNNTPPPSGDQTQSQDQNQTQNTDIEGGNTTSFNTVGDSTSKIGNVGAKVGDVLSQGVTGGTFGSSSSSRSASNSSSDNHLSNVGNTHIVHQAPEFKDRVPDPAAIALTTGDCLGSWGGGATGSGFGFNFGKTKIDHDCNVRRNAQEAAKMGDLTMQYEVMCHTADWVKADKALNRNQCAENRGIEEESTVQAKPRYNVYGNQVAGR